jgi:hypothetical protein
MTPLGIALIVCGLTLVCAGVIFRLIARREPSDSQESLEESLERFDRHIQRTFQTIASTAISMHIDRAAADAVMSCALVANAEIGEVSSHRRCQGRNGRCYGGQQGV